MHKKTKDDFKKKNTGNKKDISSAQSTQIIEEKDEIIGYSALEMKKIFLGDDFKFKGKVDLIQKKKVDKSPEKSGKRSVSKKKKTKNENKFNEKGERVIGNIEITAYLKRPREQIIKEDKNINNLASSISKMPNVNNNVDNNINNKSNQSPMKEFIIGQPPMFNNNIIKEDNSNENKEIHEQSENGEEKLMVDDGMEKIRTDINGDILILYLKINELKSSNDLYNPENSISNNILFFIIIPVPNYLVIIFLFDIKYSPIIKTQIQK